MIRPVLVSATDIAGGAARASYRLHMGLRKIGLDSRYVVSRKLGNDPYTYGSGRWPGSIRHVGLSILDALPLVFYPRRRRAIWSNNLHPFFSRAAISKHRPDIVNIHWIGRGYFPFWAFRPIACPIVWTFHDMWPFTGGCHYDQSCGRYTVGCGSCPQLHSARRNDLSRFNVNAQKRILQDVNLTLVTPSRWLAQCARSSVLFSDRPIEVIPYGLDTSRFRPYPKQDARQQLGLPQEPKFILFGAGGPVTDPRKGFHHLSAALQSIATSTQLPVECLIFGSDKNANIPEVNMPIRNLGRISDDQMLSQVYSAADLFVAPSIQDNLPNTVVESLACGTPVAAFHIGGMPDMIEHQATGYLAQAFDIDDLAYGIMWLLSDDQRLAAMRDRARGKALAEYDWQVQANRYHSLFQRLHNDAQLFPTVTARTTP